MSIKENLNSVLEKIKRAEIDANRPEGSVKLLAVSKFNPVESVIEARENGQIRFGENRIQEAYDKFNELYKSFPETELHIIGQLQTNKVKKACEIACVIESVDRLDLIKEIEKQASKLNKTIKIFLEMHTGEESKAGFDTVEKIEEALQYIKDGNAPHVVPAGFMTMAPFTDNEDLVRKSFRTLRETKNTLQAKFPEFNLSELSMGMSGDFKIAIQEGSTQVRIGTAIFGERDYSK